MKIFILLDLHIYVYIRANKKKTSCAIEKGIERAGPNFISVTSITVKKSNVPSNSYMYIGLIHATYTPLKHITNSVGYHIFFEDLNRSFCRRRLVNLLSKKKKSSNLNYSINLIFYINDLSVGVTK